MCRSPAVRAEKGAILPAVAIYGAHKTTDGNGDDVLHLSRTVASIGSFATPVIIRTSATLDRPRLDGLSKRAREKHGEMARFGRAQKGRLLYVASGSTVLAYLGVHVPPAPGPIICEAFAAVIKATDEQRALMQIYLLEAAEELSVNALNRAGATGRIAWATDDDDVRGALKASGFESAPKPPHSDCNRKHYLEATFT